MAFKLDIKRVGSGFRMESNAVPDGAVSAADVNSALTKNPDHVHVVMENPSEAQLRGLLQYAKQINNGKDTSSIETAIAAVW